MNNLISKQVTIDSREVAEMIGLTHWEVLRKIEGAKDRNGYIQILADNQMVVSDYYLKSSYQDESGKENTCYQCTKMGCEMLGNKLTGEKGVLFTAKYVKKFNDMEQIISNRPAIDTTQLSPETQLLLKLSQSIANNELEQKMIKQEIAFTKEQTAAVKEEVQGIRELVEIRPSENWRNETNTLVKKICYNIGDYKTPKEEIYKALQERARCDLKIRLKNMRGRLALEGATKTKLDNLNYLDVISEDNKLIEIYTSIVKEMAIKYKVA